MTAADSAPAEEPSIHSAFGPPPTNLELFASIGVGVVSLFLVGLVALLFGALVNEGRLTQGGIGFAAGGEALVMALATGLFGAIVPTTRMKLWGVGASLVLAAADSGTMAAHGNGVILLRALAGVPEGILLWITIGMIARTATPERWAAILFTSSTISQVAGAGLLTAVLLRHFGANGGFGMLAAVGLAGVALSLFLPDHFAPLPKGENESGAPPPRGWLALAAILMISAAVAAVGVYLLPLAQRHGLSETAASAAVTVSLVAQVPGGGLAALIAGRVRYLVVFTLGALGWLAAFLIFALPTPGWTVFAAMALAGVVILLVPPFFVPMTIEVDASRRTAVQSGAVQLLAGALGPLAAALLVGDRDIRGVLWLAGAMLAIGLGLSAVLHFTATHEPA